MTTLLELIASHEGIVDHLYLDAKGNPTCGVGQLVAKAGDLSRYRWTDFPSALRDYALLSEKRRNCEYGKKWPASRYKPLCAARMIDPKEGLSDTIARLTEALERRTDWFKWQAEGRQWAMVDMAYQMGVDGLLRGFPLMCAAMKAAMYLEAAKECHSPDASLDRNAWRAERITTGNTK